SGIIEVNHTILIVAEVAAYEFGAIEEVQFEISVDIGDHLFVRNRISVDNGIGCTFGSSIKDSRKDIFEYMYACMLFGTLHFLFDTPVRNVLVSFNGDLVDADLATFVHIKAEFNAVGQGRILFLDHFNGGIEVTLVYKVITYFSLGVIKHIFPDNSPPDFNFFLQLALLGLVDTGIFNPAKPRPLCQFQEERNIVAF